MDIDTSKAISSEMQLRQLRWRFFLLLFSFIAPISVMAWLYQAYAENNIEQRIFSEVQINVQQKKLAFEQVVQLATSHLDRVGLQLQDAMESPALRINQGTWGELRKLGIHEDGRDESVVAASNEKWRQRFGAIFIHPRASNKPMIAEQAAALMAVFPSIHATHQTNPYFQWTAFYLTSGDLFATYPFVSEVALQKATNTHTNTAMFDAVFDAKLEKLMQQLMPQANPERRMQWIAPYFDSGGKGAMVSLLAPFYVDHVFVGALSTDVTLTMFAQVLNEKQKNLAHFIVIDQDDNLIADDRDLAQKDHAIHKAKEMLPDSLLLAIHSTPSLQASKLQRSTMWYWSSTQIAGSNWRLLSYFNQSELTTASASESQSTTQIMLSLLAVLCLAAWAIAYYFALPSLKLANYLIQLSHNPHTNRPDIPKAWQASFELVAKTSLQRQSYLTEIENQASNLEKTVVERTKEVVAQSQLAEKARNDIALLSELGREITASLDVSAIEKNLLNHIQQLLAADYLAIGQFDASSRMIHFKALPNQESDTSSFSLHFDHCTPAIQVCLQQKGEFIQDLAYRDFRQQVSTDCPTVSSLFIPIIIKEIVFGLICIQQRHPHQYHQNDLAILRSLSAYASVALDNALTYQRLKQTQEKLIEQEKHAALGSIVVAVAHELNTPIGNSLLAASSLVDMTEATNVQIMKGEIRRSSFNEYAKSTKEICELILRNLRAAAQLITSFKQIAVDQSPDQRRRFNLAQVTKDVLSTTANSLRERGVQVIVEIDDSIELDSYLGPYCKVIDNLLQNAKLHAFEAKPQGTIQIIGVLTEDRKQIMLSVSDNGDGIDTPHLSHIFEPFYTTKLGQGNSGLGLHICYNIVNALLGGSIEAKSQIKVGTSIIIHLPYSAS
ncbi:MAG: GAF domain-containing protein [Undibacterium sp.]|nr:GAF domain-containing protein [Undibacterium sp.]